MKLALENICYVVAYAFGAIKNPCEIPALLLDARKVLRNFCVYPITSFIHKICAVLKLKRAPVLSQINKYLQACTSSL